MEFNQHLAHFRKCGGDCVPNHLSTIVPPLRRTQVT